MKCIYHIHVSVYTTEENYLEYNVQQLQGLYKLLLLYLMK